MNTRTMKNAMALGAAGALVAGAIAMAGTSLAAPVPSNAAAVKTAASNQITDVRYYRRGYRRGYYRHCCYRRGYYGGGYRYPWWYNPYWWYSPYWYSPWSAYTYYPSYPYGAYDDPSSYNSDSPSDYDAHSNNLSAPASNQDDFRFNLNTGLSPHDSGSVQNGQTP